MNKITLTQWDSDFFNKKIGQITISNTDSENEIFNLFNNIKKENYDIIYLFTKENKKISKEILKKFNGDLVDVKIVFQKTIVKEQVLDNNRIRIYKSNKLREDLIELAYLSGTYSRFNTDFRFSNQDFKKLYLEWLKKSISKELAEDILVYIEKDKIIGFVTITLKNNIGQVGLIAVDPNHQGKKIGSALLNQAAYYLASINVLNFQIPTQKMNNSACNFYLKNNFNIISTMNIYHFSPFK